MTASLLSEHIRSEHPRVKRILVVDDSSAARTLATGMLEASGFHMETATLERLL